MAVCGPTAAGKSALADVVAERLSGAFGERVPAIVVDSMQVYEEIPVTTNQARGREAEMVGIVSVAEAWTVARHKEGTEAVMGSLPEGLPVVLDAGTGMYLNAIVLEVPLAPKVNEGVRAEAERRAVGAVNPRRAARALELELAGAPGRGSIWDGEPRYDLSLLYLRPERESLDRNIAERSAKIARGGGAGEAERLLEGGLISINPSVYEAIGVREMLLHASGELSLDEAEVVIAARTRRLARRQMRWFDKLARKLAAGPSRILVVENAADEGIEHLMHGIVGM